MDRRSERHRQWQVDLPRTLRYQEIVSRLNFRLKVRPSLGAALGVVGFVGGGAMVVTVASFLALHI